MAVVAAAGTRLSGPADAAINRGCSGAWAAPGAGGGGCRDSIDFRGIHFVGGELNWGWLPPASSEHEQATSSLRFNTLSLRWYLEMGFCIHVTIPTFQCLHEEHKITKRQEVAHFWGQAPSLYASPTV